MLCQGLDGPVPGIAPIGGTGDTDQHQLNALLPAEPGNFSEIPPVCSGNGGPLSTVFHIAVRLLRHLGIPVVEEVGALLGVQIAVVRGPEKSFGGKNLPVVVVFQSRDQRQHPVPEDILAVNGVIQGVRL